jgi:hypothetical protein
MHDVHDPLPSPEPATPNTATLTTEISTLWNTHQQVQTSAKHSRQELQAIRRDLGEKLHAAKAIYARPGCKGAWRSFLATVGVPRATADRLSRAHAQSLRPAEENLLSESIPAEPTEAQLSTLVCRTWQRVEGKLPSARSRYNFLRCLAGRAGLTLECCQDGFAVREPDVEREQAVPAPQEVVTMEPEADEFAEVL